MKLSTVSTSAALNRLSFSAWSKLWMLSVMFPIVFMESMSRIWRSSCFVTGMAGV
jgi:hypothetical protein